jgi:tyrosyl-tRNA synthetase
VNLVRDKALDLLLSGVAEIRPGGPEALKSLLEQASDEKKPLRIKLGIDPTSSDLHLGHMVCINKLRQFQDLGHTPVLIIGAYTAQLGDPSGRNEARPPLSKEQVKLNAKTYLDQVSRILDLEKTEVVNNADWFDRFSMKDLIDLASKLTVNQMIVKDAFGKRLEAGLPLYVHELLYPLLQGFDSVEVKADIEIGGTDQTFNLMIGRDLQRIKNLRPQLTLTMPLLIGLDGKKKMSKTSLNYIALNDSPDEMFGKIMSIPDELIPDYYSLAAQTSREELLEIRAKLEPSSGFNPRDVKADLGKKIVSIYYDQTKAEKALESFEKLFRNKEIPEEIPESKIELDIELIQLLFDQNLVPSKKEAKRLVIADAIRLDGEKISDPFFLITKSHSGKVIQVGKRKFLRII